MALPANWASGQTFTAAAENAVEEAVNANTTAVTALQGVNGLVKSNGSGTFSAASATSDYVPWSGATGGVLPATSSQKLTTQGGNTLDDGSGNVVIKGGTLDGVTVGGTSAAAKVNSLTFGNKPTGNTVISGAITPWINDVVTYSGTTSGVGHYNYVGINDQLAGDTNYIYGLRVLHSVVSPSVGPRSAIYGAISVSGSGTTTQTEAQYVGVTGHGQISTGLGGTGFGPNQSVGGAWGGWFLSQATAGTFLGGVIGVEIDVFAASGTSVFTKNGLRIADTTSAVRGTVEDAAVVIANQTGTTATWTNGILFGSQQGSVNTSPSTAPNWPFASDSTMIGTSTPYGTDVLHANIGIDFSPVTFAGPALKTGAAPIAMAEMTAAPAKVAGEGQLYVASDASLHYVSPTADINLISQAPGFAPADYGYIGWAFDPIYAGGVSAALTAGEAYFVMIPVRQATTITNVVMEISTAGSGLTAGECFAGLFNESGTLLSATADQSTNWQTAGTRVMALTTPQVVQPGFYYVAFYANGTTTPKLYCDTAGLSSLGLQTSAPGPDNSRPRFGGDTTHTGLTTAFYTPATIAFASAYCYWAAVS